LSSAPGSSSLSGAFSIAGVPLFNGFVSKSMIVSAAGYAKHGPVELILLVVGMGTFLSIACKLVWFTFFAEGHGATVKQPVPRSMMAAMVLSASLCIVTGVPGGFQMLYDHLPTPVVGHAKPHADDHHEPAATTTASTAHAAGPKSTSGARRSREVRVPWQCSRNCSIGSLAGKGGRPVRQW